MCVLCGPVVLNECVQLAESLADRAARRPSVHGLGLERGADTDSDAEEWDRHESAHPAHDNTAVWTHTDEVGVMAVCIPYLACPSSLSVHWSHCGGFLGKGVVWDLLARVSSCACLLSSPPPLPSLLLSDPSACSRRR